ncbi:MAG: adenylyl-sulfate kinase [Deltaproteobacteria bacterium]|nr:adenylyl-sulfate kinase [Deltaproteobacteria bacterium]
MTKTKSTNVVWHQAMITKTKREKLLQQRGAALWFTGLSGSGKSTLAHEVENRLYDRGYHTYVLDGDNVRHGLNGDLGFSPEDRQENIRRLAELVRLFTDAGVIVLSAFISPFRSDRQKARELLTQGDFLEVYCRCSVQACEQRDPKGLYKKARAGEIPEFTGISSPYEEPEQPEIITDTDRDSLETCAEQIIAHLRTNGILNKE